MVKLAAQHRQRDGVESPLVASGGYEQECRYGRPKLRVAGVVTVIWLCYSIIAAVLLFTAPGPWGWLEASWFALILLNTLPAAATVWFWRTEKPRRYTRWRPVSSGTSDPRRLY